MTYPAWIKKHRHTIFWLGIIAALVWWIQTGQRHIRPLSSGSTRSFSTFSESAGMAPSFGKSAASDMAVESLRYPSPDVAPSGSQDRLVSRNADLSLVVTDVETALTNIEQTSAELGGFLIDSNLYSPLEGTRGYVTVRVPADKLNDALAAFSALGSQVVSQSIHGQDVTDQYEDIESKLATLTQSKTKFEAILEQAENVDETLRVQQQVISLQDQIDALKGRQLYLERTTALSLVTVDLATDELSLPFAPDGSWRPQLVFKYAVRSLMLTLRSAANALIWISVFAVVWIPVFLIVWVVIKLRRRQKPKKA